MTILRNGVLGWVVALLVVAGFTRLGFWQLDRMHEKQAMLDAVATVLHERHPVPLAVAEDPARTRDYDWSNGTGRFAGLPPVLLDNQTHEQRPGVRAYRVFQPDAGDALLVELGWLPVPGDRSMPSVPLPQGVGHVAGLLMPPPSAGLAKGTPVRVGEGYLAIALDPGLVAKALGLPALSPRILKLDPAQPLPAGPDYIRDLDILPNTLPPDRHLGYAVQWFGLALAVFVTALVLTFRRQSRKP